MNRFKITRKLLPYFAIFFLFQIAKAQEIKPVFEGYKLMRSDENEDFWRKNKPTKPLLYPLKLIPLNPSHSVNFTIGGQIRTRYEVFQNDTWSDNPKQDKGIYGHRLALHTGLQLGKHFRVFGELYHGFYGQKVFSQYEKLDLHQALAEFTLPLETTQLKLIAGRQEFNWGTGRIVSLREALNMRRSFDGARLISRSHKLKIEGFYALEVIPQFDPFNNSSRHAPKFWGLNFAFALPKKLGNLELYYYGYQRINAKFQNASGLETRHSLAFRSFIENGKHFNHNSGIIYQFGSIDKSAISAWSFQSDMHYIWSEARYKPNLGLKLEYVTGDKNASDQQLNTFNPMFNNPSYFGLLNKMTSMNLKGIHPSFQLNLKPTLRVKAEANFYWRANKNDGLYAPSLANIRAGKNTQDSYIGTQLGASFEWDLSKNVTFSNEFAYYIAGKYLEDSGGSENITYNVTTLNFRF
jgi:Alginate export